MLSIEVDTGVTATNLQTSIQNRVINNKWQLVQVVYDNATSTYTIIYQKIS